MVTAVYIRVSRIDLKPENQRLELERYCKAMGIEYQVFEEKESTRKTRPIKQQLMLDSVSHKFDSIIVWKLDRWARSLQELIYDVGILRQHKVEFFSLKDNLKVDDSPSNTLMLQILGAFAEFERAIIRERTMTGLDRARSEGKKLGRPFKHKRVAVSQPVVPSNEAAQKQMGV
jgi:DNA invertase Pin-like site-specific DNA recombinase